MVAKRAGKNGLAGNFDEKSYPPGMQHFPDPQSAWNHLQEQQNQEEQLQLDEAEVIEARKEAFEAAPPEEDAALIHAEEVDEASRERAVENDEQVNKAYSGVLKLRRGLEDLPRRSSPDQIARRTADMIFEVGSIGYQQAYNNTVSFNIGGQNVEFKQGEMFDSANDLISESEDKLEELRANGASEEEIRAEERRLENLRRIAELTDPSHGDLTDEEREEIQTIFDNNPELAADFANNVNLRAANSYVQDVQLLDERLAAGEIEISEYNTMKDEIVASVPDQIADEYEWLMEFREEAADRESRVSESPNPLFANLPQSADVTIDVSENPLFASGSFDVADTNPLLGGQVDVAENPLLRTTSAINEADAYSIGNLDKINPLYNAKAAGEPETVVAENDLDQDQGPAAFTAKSGNGLTA